MDAATLLIRLKSHYAFSQAEELSLARLSQTGVFLQTDAGDVLADAAVQSEYLFLLLSGNAQLQDPDQELTLKLQPENLVGYGTRSNTHGAAWMITALTTSSWIRWPAHEVDTLCRQNPALDFYLSHRSFDSTGPVSRTEQQGWLSSPLHTLLRQAVPITIPHDASIQDAALRMQAQRVSSILVMDEASLFGIVTDKDLRNRVIATGLDIHQSVSQIATQHPKTLQALDSGFDALMLMAQHHIHHIPLMDGSQPIGVLSAGDLYANRLTSAELLVKSIQEQSSVEGLRSAVAGLGQLQQHLANQSASGLSIGKMVTSITDALTRKLLELAHLRFGPPPVPYVWVAAGSQARSEQSTKTDQDNCLILDDSYSADEHEIYFKELATWVCDGLHACGYVHCPGGIMAMTPQWCQPLKQWREYFERWIYTPEPLALMWACVFFDIRAIHGDSSLLQRLRSTVLESTRKNSLFLSHMVSNALKHQPPLGLFGQLVLSRSADYPRTIDLKHSGTVPIIDLARVYALAGGVHAVNTDERLALASQGLEISQEKSRDLRDALEMITSLRVHHQARLLAAGQAPNNHLSLHELSHLERSFLKEAFHVVKGLQSVLEQRYGGHS
ncbi:COG2905 Predicted signal-transduction protein containing cAMP-binding and CBS domains [Comamonadaceae bacterium]